MEKYLDRALTENEVVHHLDCNKSNNRLGNLLLLSNAMHAKLHFWIDTGAFVHESYERNRMNSEKSKVIELTMTILSQALYDLTRKVQRLDGV
jgi:hypothetical protein